jgi:predicted SnoaL-like aldol condensation-catalyzing enzyme
MPNSQVSVLRNLADCYMEAANTGNLAQVISIFSDDPTYINGYAPHVLHSRQEIRRIYEEIFEAMPRHPGWARIAHFVEQGNECAFEIEAAVPGSDEYAVIAADRFTLGDDGRVSRFAAYFFGPAPDPRFSQRWHQGQHSG